MFVYNNGDLWFKHIQIHQHGFLLYFQYSQVYFSVHKVTRLREENWSRKNKPKTIKRYCIQIHIYTHTTRMHTMRGKPRKVCIFVGINKKPKEHENTISRPFFWLPFFQHPLNFSEVEKFPQCSVFYTMSTMATIFDNFVFVNNEWKKPERMKGVGE